MLHVSYRYQCATTKIFRASGTRIHLELQRVNWNFTVLIGTTRSTTVWHGTTCTHYRWEPITCQWTGTISIKSTRITSISVSHVHCKFCVYTYPVNPIQYDISSINCKLTLTSFIVNLSNVRCLVILFKKVVELQLIILVLIMLFYIKGVSRTFPATMDYFPEVSVEGDNFYWNLNTIYMIFLNCFIISIQTTIICNKIFNQ